VNTSNAVARVYARALFDIGVEDGSLGRIYDDLQGVKAAAESSTEAVQFLNSPKLRREDKIRVMDEIFKDHVSRPVLGLLHVLVEKRRESVLDNIIAEFGKYRDEHEGRVHARVTTARPLAEAERERLAAAIAKRTGKIVEIHEEIDPAVIGGIRVNLGDQVLDGTIRRRLEDLRREFNAAEFSAPAQ